MEAQRRHARSTPRHARVLCCSCPFCIEIAQSRSAASRKASHAIEEQPVAADCRSVHALGHKIEPEAARLPQHSRPRALIMKRALATRRPNPLRFNGSNEMNHRHELSTMRVRSGLAATFIAVAAVATTGGTASARTAYDGIWSVVVAAEAGACSGAYRYPVAIVNGYVRHVDSYDQSFSINGRVGAGGRVNVRVARGDLQAFGVGRLSRLAGGGTWRSPNGCAGRWQAGRHG
jgi:hypothetical protein